MPNADREGHTDRFWSRVDGVVQTIVGNDAYLQKKRNSELTAIVMEQFAVETRMAQHYIAEAKKEIRRLSKSNSETALKRALLDRESLIKRARNEKGDKFKALKLELEAMKDRDNLLGLYVQQIEHKGKINIQNFDVSKLEDSQIAEIKRRLLRGEDVESYLMSICSVK